MTNKIGRAFLEREFGVDHPLLDRLEKACKGLSRFELKLTPRWQASSPVGPYHCFMKIRAQTAQDCQQEIDEFVQTVCAGFDVLFRLRPEVRRYIHLQEGAEVLEGWVRFSLFCRPGTWMLAADAEEFASTEGDGSGAARLRVGKTGQAELAACVTGSDDAGDPRSPGAGGAVLEMERKLTEIFEAGLPKTPEMKRVRRVARTLALADGCGDWIDRIVMGHPAGDGETVSALASVGHKGVVAVQFPLQPAWAAYIRDAQAAIVAVEESSEIGMLRQDADVQEALRWLTFKNSGADPEEGATRGIRKICDALYGGLLGG